MWFVGVFEGEGTFSFDKDIAKALIIQMTDLDTLQKVQCICGGNIRPIKKRKEHWKDCWVWYLQGERSLKLAEEIYPYLMSRRQKRCEEFCSSKKQHSLVAYRNRANLKREKAIALRKQGLTHKEIARQLNIERSYVSHLLGKNTWWMGQLLVSCGWL